MGLKDIAIAAANEQKRHEDEQRRITAEQMTETFRIKVTQWLAEVFTAPDELLVVPPAYYGHPEAYARWDEDWFQVAENKIEGSLKLSPRERCPSRQGKWHLVDGSMHGLSRDRGITTLEEMGRWLIAVERSAPGTSRCHECDRAFGAAFDTSGSRWVGVVTKLGDLPRMAAEHGITPQA